MHSPPLDADEFRRWREEASRARDGARHEADAGLHNWSCFLSEQAAQLAMKALLHGLGKGPWGYDLLRLGQETDGAGIAVPSEAHDALARLARHYIPARYPDAHASGSASSRYRASDSAQAFADAEQVLAFVDAAWRRLGG